MPAPTPVFVTSNLGDIGGGALPPSVQTVFGGSANGPGGVAGAVVMPEEGNLLRQVSAGLNPASTAADVVLAVYTLPAGSFDISGRGINLLAMGSFAANVNTKTVKIIYNPTTAVVGQAVVGGTTIASGTAATAATGGGFCLEANVFKYGGAGSNTQVGLHAAFQSGNAVGALAAPTLLIAPENAPITIAVTGNAATTATDIALNLFEINGMN